ncbi:hypothetical protein T484DRAFT_1617566, partial [Baffinella frigidus]
NPKPETPKPKPQTPNPKPLWGACTLNPKPETPTPKPETRNPKPQVRASHGVATPRPRPVIPISRYEPLRTAVMNRCRYRYESSPLELLLSSSLFTSKSL